MSAPTTPAAAPRAAAPSFRLPPIALPLAGSALAWAVLCVALPPARQNFPLNDDWAFARGAFQFARGDGLHYGGWASMPQLGQWLWAAPFLLALGETHFALRAATVALSWLGLWAFYDLLRQQGQPPGRAALTAAALAANPLFVLLQGTFMTDVPALSLSLAALALYGRSFRLGRPGWLLAACAVAVLAAATRQNTAIVALVAAVQLRRQPGLRRRWGWWLGTLFPAAAAAAIYLWFQGRADARALRPALPDPATFLSLPFVALHLLGLSAVPVLLAEPRLASRRVAAVALLFMAACAGACLYFGTAFPYGGLFPYTENMLTPRGAFAGSRFTGPFVAGHRPELLGTAARVLLTAAGCVAGAALADRFATVRRGAWTHLLALFTLLQIPFLVIAPDLYDRYFLFLLPGALALAWGEDRGKREESPGRRWAALAALAVLGLVSLGLMHDWLAWNGARWELGRRALAAGARPLDVEGGVEWDGWFAPPDSERDEPPPSPYPVLPFTKEWFPAVRGRYALSFSEIQGTRRIDAEPYDVWLPPGRREFSLIEVPPIHEERHGQNPRSR